MMDVSFQGLSDPLPPPASTFFTPPHFPFKAQPLPPSKDKQTAEAIQYQSGTMVLDEFVVIIL